MPDDAVPDPDEMTSVIDRPDYAAVRDDLMKEGTRLRAELKVPDVETPDVYGIRPDKPAGTKTNKLRLTADAARGSLAHISTSDNECRYD